MLYIVQWLPPQVASWKWVPVGYWLNRDVAVEHQQLLEYGYGHAARVVFLNDKVAKETNE